MPTVTVTDLRHFLDEDGQLPDELPGPALRLVRHHGAIVEWVTIWNLYAPNPTNVACRRRPGRTPCPGTIVAGTADDSDAIVWICPECRDQGWIGGWQGTPWDRTDEAFGDDEDDAVRTHS